MKFWILKDWKYDGRQNFKLNILAMKALFFLSAISVLLISQKVTSQDVGTPAPDFMLSTIDGNTFQLSSNSGKVIMILFFGNGCPHCLSGGPAVQSDIVAAFKDNSDFLPIGVDAWDGNSTQVTSFRNSTGLQMDMCLMGSSIQTAYGLANWDRIVVVGSDGKLVYKGDGFASQTIAPAKEAIQQALNGGSMTSAVYNTHNENRKGLMVYPNPASEQANISFDLKAPSEVNILIQGIDGKIVYAQQAGYFTAGEHAVPLNAGNLQSGVYYIVLKTTDSTEVSKFVVY